MSFETSKAFASKGGFNVKGGFGSGKQGFGAGGGDDPLEDVEYTGDLAADCGREFDALQESFEERVNREGMAERAKAERDRFRKATDSEFWFAVCFTTREEKEAFLSAAKVRKNILGDKYLDGKRFAQVLGIEM